MHTPVQIGQIDNMEDLNAVIEAVKVQQKILKARVINEVKASLSVGDNVKINSRSGTKFGIVKQIKIKKAVVDISGVSWDVPLTLITQHAG